MPRASFIKHAFEGLVINEFEGMRFEPDSAPPPSAGDGKNKKQQGGGGGGGGSSPPGASAGAGDLLTGEDVLRRFGLAGASVPSTVRAQCRVLAFHCWTTLCLLRARQPRYVTPSPAVAEEEVVVEEGVGEKKEK